VVEARRIVRIEHRNGRHRSVGRQVDAELRRRRRLRRGVCGLQLQIGQRAGVELSGVGDREYLQALVLVVHDVAVAIHSERARPRVRDHAVVAHREEPFAADREIERAIREIHAALRELLRDGRQPDAVADLLRADRENVRELATRALEAGGVRVRDVVRGHVQIGRGRIQTAECYCERH
jgi:hypothetical protein